jgi:hypothetical protein
MMFLLDANAFMEASRLYYDFDIAPGFWSWLEKPSLAGQVGSMQVIKDEITAGTGQLVTWASGLPPEFWLQETAETVAVMADLSAWAAHPSRPYSQAAVNEFLGSADLRIVAHASAIGATVVTREQPGPDSKKSVKIPEACDEVNVVWTDPFSAYRALGLQLRS